LGVYGAGSNSLTNIEGGLTLLNSDGTGAGTLDNGNIGSDLNFLDSETLDHASVIMDATTISVASGSTLTLGSALQFTLVPAEYQTFSGPGTIVNDSSIEASGEYGIHGYVGGQIWVSAPFVNNGTFTLTNGGMFVSTTNLTNNGTMAGVLNDGTVIDAIDIGGNLSGAGTFANVVIQVAGTVEAGVTISGKTSPVYLGFGAISPQATIVDFAAGGQIGLSSVQFDGNINAFWSGNATIGTLSVDDGATTLAAITMVGIQPGATFSVTSSGSANNPIITTDNIPCFLAGTRIRTPDGEVTVERLRPGDLVLALKSGRPQPVRWIGHRQIRVVARHPDPASVWPVCIRANAIADQIPRLDLYLSPEHAVFLHGVLVPVRHLVNGNSVRYAPRDTVTYVHLELPAHDLVLAEGLPSETYLDTGNRADFDNAGPAVNAHPTFAAADANAIWQARACAPQVRGGPELAAIRKVLNERAARLGFAGDGNARRQTNATAWP
jgi:hypothetical protein